MKSGYLIWKYCAGRLMTHTQLGHAWKKLEFRFSAPWSILFMAFGKFMMSVSPSSAQNDKWRLCLTARRGSVTTSLLIHPLPLSADLQIMSLFMSHTLYSAALYVLRSLLMSWHLVRKFNTQEYKTTGAHSRHLETLRTNFWTMHFSKKLEFLGEEDP